jgi:hypothetical protein
MPSMGKRQRQGKELGIMVGELVESMEGVKKSFLQNFPYAKKRKYLSAETGVALLA